MTYADLIAEIKLLSKRFDIDDKIAIALRMTTLRAHRTDYYWRDLQEVNVNFADSQEVTIDIVANFTRFRQVSYVRYMNADTGALGQYLEEADAANLLDNEMYYKDNVWYLAGTNLQVRAAISMNALRVGYWQNPDVTAGSYNSWIKDELPDLLVQGSLAYLYNMSGKQEEARALNRMVGFEPDPANRAPGMTLVDQLRAIGLRGSGHA